MARPNEISSGTIVKLSITETILASTALLSFGFGAGRLINNTAKDIELVNTKLEQFEKAGKLNSGCTAEECAKWLERLKNTGFLDAAKK